MPNEIEAKIRVTDFRAVRAAMELAGAEFLGAAVETDQFFDRPDGSLRKADCGLRLRRTKMVRQASRLSTLSPGQRPTGETPVAPLLTYKGPKARGTSLKVRREIQTRLGDAQAMTQMLRALGFEPMVIVRKRRSSYRMGPCRVELDELRGIGRFVEVEGPSRRAVEAACKKLGLKGERVTQPYVAMVSSRTSAPKHGRCDRRRGTRG